MFQSTTLHYPPHNSRAATHACNSRSFEMFVYVKRLSPWRLR